MYKSSFHEVHHDFHEVYWFRLWPTTYQLKKDISVPRREKLTCSLFGTPSTSRLTLHSLLQWSLDGLWNLFLVTILLQEHIPTLWIPIYDFPRETISYLQKNRVRKDMTPHCVDEPQHYCFIEIMLLSRAINYKFLENSISLFIPFFFFLGSSSSSRWDSNVNSLIW